jgi:oxygen-dependent protoporphyrinogen oxidase
MAIRVQTLVIGAGISGLTAGYALKKTGISTLIVDSASRPGGVIQSEKREGYLVECGPQSFSGTAQLNSLCEDLGLIPERVFADPKAPRYILINGVLKPVPMGPGLLGSSFLAGGTRGAIVRDMLGSSAPPEPDESLEDFVHRKFSDTLLEVLVGPFVSGIYAGDPKKLSLRAAFPALHEAEKTTGSIVRGLYQIRKKQKAKNKKGEKGRTTLQSFRAGTESVILALTRALGEQLLCRAEVTSLNAVKPNTDPAAPRFQATLRTAEGMEIVEAERLVVAVPTNAAGKLLASFDPGFESQLSGIEYAGIAVVSLGYRKEQISNSLTGFGFLVPRSAGLSVLGTVWNSWLFPGRAPEGHALLTSFVGGATNPEALRQSSKEISATVHRELAPLLGITGEPNFAHTTIWPRAIPQYNLGHTARVAAIEIIRKKIPGLYFSGNYLEGPAIGMCVERSLRIAEEIRISFAN